jgi:hypothetical protein
MAHGGQAVGMDPGGECGVFANESGWALQDLWRCCGMVVSSSN